MDNLKANVVAIRGYCIYLRGDTDVDTAYLRSMLAAEGYIEVPMVHLDDHGWCIQITTSDKSFGE